MNSGEMADAPVSGSEEPVESGADPTGERTDDGGDVAASRDPDAIAHEIEQTRAELADTIDAIADRISPKRAAARSAQAVKAQVASAKDKVTGDSAGAAAAPTGGPVSAPDAFAAPGLPVGPIAAVVGVLLLVVVYLRRRR